MSNNTKNNIIVPLLFILVIVGVRALAPLSPTFKFVANFSALGAVAIFSGAYFKNKILSYATPLAILLLSDLALIFTMGSSYALYGGWYFTYIAFALMVLASQLIIKKIKVVSVLATSLTAVLIHWVVTDYGVWIGSTMYPQTLAGFWACLVAAIPFELNFLYGTLVYSAVLFLGIEYYKSKQVSLQASRA